MTASAPGAGDLRDIAIERIGARGDGVGHADGARIFVPLAAPGDRLRVRLGKARGDGIEGEIVERLADGPDRAAPPCPYFGDCGGCQVQHLARSAYLAWKRALIVEAFAREGLAPEVAEVVALPPATRRRAKFVAEARDGRLVLGFNARRSRRAVDVAACLVLAPPLARLVPILRASLADILGDGERVELQLLTLGDAVEMLVVGRIGAGGRAKLAALAWSGPFARVAWRAEADDPIAILAERAAMTARFGAVSVELPPGAFLQASLEGEEALRGFVVDAVRRAKRIADLFAGAGSFAAALASRASVHAVEGDAAAARALEAAARAHPGVRLAVERRDLERRPLLPPELARFDAVIFDPPRGGAAAQAKQLARSDVPVAVAVSCNPATLARDARLLTEGGYVLGAVRPVDQFVWSAHIEAVAVFRKPRKGV